MKGHGRAESVGFLAASMLRRRKSRWSIIQRRVPLANASRAMRLEYACRRETAYVASRMQFGLAIAAASCWRSLRALEAYTRDLSLSELPASASADLTRGMVNNVLSGTSHEARSIALAPLENMNVSKALTAMSPCKPLIVSKGQILTASARVYRPEDGGKTEAATDFPSCATTLDRS